LPEVRRANRTRLQNSSSDRSSQNAPCHDFFHLAVLKVRLINSDHEVGPL
jgi:hypothetical protein